AAIRGGQLPDVRAATAQLEVVLILRPAMLAHREKQLHRTDLFRFELQQPFAQLVPGVAQLLHLVAQRVQLLLAAQALTDEAGDLARPPAHAPVEIRLDGLPERTERSPVAEDAQRL